MELAKHRNSTITKYYLRIIWLGLLALYGSQAIATVYGGQTIGGCQSSGGTV